MSFTRNPRPLNKCQYWIEKEPIQCIHWNVADTICTFEKETTSIIGGVETTFVQKGDLYPYCNYIGTAKFSCTTYANTPPSEALPNPPLSEETLARCVLPDPYRHVSMSINCSKWVTPPEVVDDQPGVLNYTKINGYNEGKCDSKGTDVTCSGFAPHHLGFDTVPTQDVCTIPGVTTSGTTTAPGFPSGSHMSMKYDILNKRAKLGGCKWWGSSSIDFTLEQSADGKLSIKAPEFNCTNPSQDVQSFSDFYRDTENTDIRPPCNGAMPECVKYTGNLASTGFLPYLSSVYLRGGDKVMAEQILEIRYNLKKETWVKQEYLNYFGDEAIIFANEGTSPEVIRNIEGNIVDYSLLAIKTEISDFTCFSINRTQVTLTKGTSSDSLTPTFPTLIKELKNLLYEPIIRSVFYKLDDVINIFETPYSHHEYILIIGDCFSFQSKIFAINASDPSTSFPFNDILSFKNMYAFRESVLGVGNDPIQAEQAFKDKHAQLECYFKMLIKGSPDKMYLNTWPETSRSFAINVKTIFGDNKILVFDTSASIYTFSVITIRKVFCGGLLAQTSFEVSLEEDSMSDAYNFEKFLLLPRFSPKISYKFKSFGSGSKAIHTYIDTKVLKLPNPRILDEKPTYFLGYHMYKIKAMNSFFIDSTCNSKDTTRLILIGNLGYVLVNIDDNNKLHNVIRKWDSGEVDENNNAKPLVLFLKGHNAKGEEISIEMEVLEYCTDRMESNQLLLKPKHSSEYVRLYNPFIEFKHGLYVYERHSFGNIPPNGEEIRDGWEEDAILIHSQAILQENGPGNYTITDLPRSPMIASIMFSGPLSGRIKGQVKTDLIINVKQPYCSDVEIMYTWSANYTNNILLPEQYCFVSDIGVREVDSSVKSFSTRCGDHNFGVYTTHPSAMWYPYEACDDYVKYNLMSGNYDRDTGIMEPWLNENGQWNPESGHGPHDIRMLGPATHFGATVDTHAHIWDCGCDYSYLNSSMISSAWFSGYAKIRAGVEGETFFYMVQNGGIGPKFGNKHRSYLHSFRSVAALDFYKLSTEGDISLDKKWLPMYEAFSDTSLSKDFVNYPWKNYFNDTDTVYIYLNPFGILIAAGNIDNIDVNEELLGTRFAFTDIFNNHSTTTGMLYPESRKAYSIGEILPKTVTAWLTYKDSPKPGTAIQWAWREYWKPLEREIFDIRQTLMSLDSDVCDTTGLHASKYLHFLDIYYTNYTYSYKIEEFRRIPREGFHDVIWEPSVYNEEKPLPTHFLIKLGIDGVVRVLNPRLELVTDPDLLDDGLMFVSKPLPIIKRHLNFYRICDNGSWLNYITSDTDLETINEEYNSQNGFILYDGETRVTTTGAAARSNAEEAKRMVETCSDAGAVIKLYFNRGLYVTANAERFAYIPKKFSILEKDYEVKLSEQSEDDTDYSTIDTSIFYPVNDNFSIKYCFITGSTVTMTFKLSKPKVIGKFTVVFKKGLEKVSSDGSEIFNYFHIPSVSFASSRNTTNGVEIVVLKSFDFESANKEESLELKEKEYSLDLSVEYMSELSTYFSIMFDYSMEDVTFTRDEINVFHYIFIESITFYEVFYISQQETIQVHERKFNISVGSYGTYPIHGFESTGSLLYPNPFELSTTYQYDTTTGMVGMPNSTGDFTSVGKTQNRFCKKIQIDGEELSGSYLDFEKKQKELYDEVALSGSSEIIFKSVADVVFKEELENIGITDLPKWECKFINNTMKPLKAVQEKQLYQPPGHQWTWDTGSFEDRIGCGGGGIGQWKAVFYYVFGRISGMYGYVGERDIFDLYSYGLSDVLTRMADPAEAVRDLLGVGEYD